MVVPQLATKSLTYEPLEDISYPNYNINHGWRFADSIGQQIAWQNMLSYFIFFKNEKEYLSLWSRKSIFEL
jgi:hypothetical protein